MIFISDAAFKYRSTRSLQKSNFAFRIDIIYFTFLLFSEELEKRSEDEKCWAFSSNIELNSLARNTKGNFPAIANPRDSQTNFQNFREICENLIRKLFIGIFSEIPESFHCFSAELHDNIDESETL